MTHACNIAGASTPTTPIPWDSSWPSFVPDAERCAILGYFEARFGIPLSTFAGYHLLERRRTYALLNCAVPLAPCASLKIQNAGLPVLRKMPHHLKPTTAALQRFGRAATRHLLDLSELQMGVLLRAQELVFQADLDPGYVVLRCEGHILGCGLYTPGRLRSQIPQRQVRHQRFI